ncbi:MAG TPA: hypothetical protein VN920_12355, partial [Pyrinomonadaceae bacterium]|nr:hypothetical protein [Pyrinomonadaceae bacterium]
AVGPESPLWLRKDREYQIAAASFYSLKFDEARARFEKIASDSESDWQQTADYLVARTLVRPASLAENEAGKREAYEQAEHHLQMLVGGKGKFHDASRKLLALVKYRAHPEQRIKELAQILSAPNANENLRQDLIDYGLLLDKVEFQISTEEAKRLKPAEQKEELVAERKEAKERYDAIQRGELLDVTIYPKMPDGQPDYMNRSTIYFKYDVSENDVLQSFEEKHGRKLTPEEIKEAKERYQIAVSNRKSLVSPNHKWDRADSTQYERCYSDCERLALDLVPDYLRADDLSDWIFTFQTQDPKAYAHALAKWRKTASVVWFVTALTRAEKTSPGLDRLISQAEKTQRESPAFPTIAYHLVRLKMASGKIAEARKLLDDIISWQSDSLPISAQNQFLEQRMQLAAHLGEFLKFAQRKPAAFYEYGRFGKMSDLFEIGRRQWDADSFAESKEEYEKQIEDRYKELLPWDQRFVFDEQSVDVFNWHFPLEALASAARNPALPDYLQRRLVLACWTRAILLKNDDVAERISPDVIKVAPEMSSVFNFYLNARTSREKEHAALYVLLKFPGLSALVAGGLPDFGTAEASDYYFETSWWCTPSDTAYDLHESKEVPKIVTKPGFLLPEQLQAAHHERSMLIAIGGGKSYLGKQVLRWAAERPEDPFVPEALFIAVKANESYKYGCDGWESDDVTRQQAEAILRTSYPRSPWTEKLTALENKNQ